MKKKLMHRTDIWAMTILLAASFSVQAQRCQEVRAGIDMGSGTTKLLVAEVDTCRQHINKVLFEDQRPVGFNQNLSQSTDNMLSPAIQSQGKAALQGLYEEAQRFHPVRFNGVATAVFRNAANGSQVIAAFNQAVPVNLRVITQRQEAELGFLSAKSMLTEQVNNDQIVVWDIGGGSMQMTTWNQQHDKWQPEIYQGKLASVTLKNYIIDVAKARDVHQVTSPNPIGSYRDAALRFVRFYATNDIPLVIKQALTTRKVIGIGGVHNYSVGSQLHMKTYDIKSLQKFSASQVWKGDSELHGEYRDTDVSNLLLVQGFMEALHIPAVTVVKANLVQGLLVQ